MLEGKLVIAPPREVQEVKNALAVYVHSMMIDKLDISGIAQRRKRKAMHGYSAQRITQQRDSITNGNQKIRSLLIPLGLLR